MKLLVKLLPCFFVFNLHAQQIAPTIQWQTLLGGTAGDFGSSIIETSSGDFLAIGQTESIDFAVNNNHGSVDVWLTKFNSQGDLKWAKCYGGSRGDGIRGFDAVKEAFDGGYVFAGLASSPNGDVATVHDTILGDCWIVKTDSSGTIEWEKTFGTSLDDAAYAILQTEDSGFIFTGHTTTNDGDVTNWHANINAPYDIWVVKLSKNGILEWQKCYGGSNNDIPQAILKTNDGNYVIAGRSQSTDGDVMDHHGVSLNYDVWIAKINQSGTILWSRSIGGSANETLGDIKELADSSFVISLTNGSTDGDFINIPRNYEVCLFHLDKNGHITWNKHYGGSRSDVAKGLLVSKEGGYITMATSYSDDGDVGFHYGDTNATDVWIFKTNDTGQFIWGRVLGGSNIDAPGDIFQCADSNYAFCGFTASTDGDLSQLINFGNDDLWALKFSRHGTLVPTQSINSKISVYPTFNNGTVFIESSSILTSQVHILDILGRTIAVKKHPYSQNVLMISDLPSGALVIEVVNDNFRQAFKVFVQK
ncbi:MAG: hypothetical protein BGO69_08395 [Bacteroidetes bacterium 46-16]|nr:MAG: hypothetical protein BGO69_08395 [Bacteroidetes bacterium 46-16]